MSSNEERKMGVVRMLRKLATIVVLGGILVLSACSGGRDRRIVCTFDRVEFSGETLSGHTRIEMDGVGNRLSVERSFLYFDLGEQEDVAAFIEEIEHEVHVLDYFLVDGLEMAVYSITDDYLILLGTANYDEMDDAALRRLLDGDGQFVSLGLTVEHYESEGAVCDEE